MAGTRHDKRHLKRMSVKFGLDRADKFGFTEDINHRGMFIRTALTARPGAIVKIEIMDPQGLIAMHGEVRWGKKVPANFLHKLKGGIGIQIKSFQSGEEIYHALCDELVMKRSRQAVTDGANIDLRL